MGSNACWSMNTNVQLKTVICISFKALLSDCCTCISIPKNQTNKDKTKQSKIKQKKPKTKKSNKHPHSYPPNKQSKTTKSKKQKQKPIQFKNQKKINKSSRLKCVNGKFDSIKSLCQPLSAT